jgi:hypothetical protein
MVIVSKFDVPVVVFKLACQSEVAASSKYKTPTLKISERDIAMQKRTHCQD